MPNSPAKQCGDACNPCLEPSKEQLPESCDIKLNNVENGKGNDEEYIEKSLEYSR